MSQEENQEVEEVLEEQPQAENTEETHEAEVSGADTSEEEAASAVEEKQE
jgi:hypothetical protein